MKKKIVILSMGIVLIIIAIVCVIFMKGKSEITPNNSNISDEKIPLITEDSLISNAKVGDYVIYNDDIGIGRWRIFDIKDEKVYIIPDVGSVGRLRIEGTKEFLNAAELIENECDKYTSAELGIPKENVRSLTEADIMDALGKTVRDAELMYQTEDEPMQKFAIYEKGTDLTQVTPNNGYRAREHTDELEEGIETPRFYLYDFAKYTAKDENGIEYAYPCNGEPVYITETYWDIEIEWEDMHIRNNEISLRELLGVWISWLPSQCTTFDYDSMKFLIRSNDNRSISAYDLLDSNGNGGASECGVRPLVILDANIKVNGSGDGKASAPWNLCLSNKENDNDMSSVQDINSILAKVKIGDYITYESAPGENNWRVFDIKDEKVILTPAEGTVGELTLNGLECGNAIVNIENECDKYTNSKLGITEENIRSMTSEDILDIMGMTVDGMVATQLAKNVAGNYQARKYAFYTHETDLTNVTPKEDYEAVNHQRAYGEEWEIPRFYIYDSAKYTTTDENGIEYAYPSGDEPVYLTETDLGDFLIDEEYTHVRNNKVNILELLYRRGWVSAVNIGFYDYVSMSGAYASIGVRREPFVMYAPMGNYCGYSTGGSTGQNGTYGVRPLIFLDSNFEVEGKGTIEEPWILSNKK